MNGFYLEKKMSELSLKVSRLDLDLDLDPIFYLNLKLRLRGSVKLDFVNLYFIMQFKKVRCTLKA